MPALPSKRRLLLGTGVLAFVTLVVVVTARRPLTGLAANSLLQLAGASEIKFTVVQASPWRVVLEEVAFLVRSQSFAAQRVSLARAHWWTPSLGMIRIEAARLPVTIDGSDTSPGSWATYQNGTARVSPLSLPAEGLSLDGQLIVRVAALPEQALAVKIEAQLTPRKTWEGQASATGPGLGVTAVGRFDPTTQALDFQLPEIALELKPWQDFVQRLVLLPGGPWKLEGRLTGSAQGKWAGKILKVGGRVQLREGRALNPTRTIAAEGVTADLEFVDINRFETRPGTLHVRELQTGSLMLRNLDADFAFAGANTVVVSRATLQALGGRLTVEPFKYFLNLREFDGVVLADNISVEEVMALTRDLPAKARGRVDGRVPVHLDEAGLRFGTGWLALKPGVAAQIQFSAAGLLTGGVATANPRYAVLNKIESGLLQLKISELRLEIRPPNAPAGRSAQLHLVAEPVDPTVRAPVVLDLNVNGPLERLLNLSMDSRISFGPKP